MRVLIAILLCFWDVESIRAEDKSESLGAIRRAVEQRRLQRQQLRVKYRVHEFVAKQQLMEYAKDRPPGAPPARLPESDLRYVVKVDYASKGGLARSWYDGPSVAGNSLRANPHPITRLFNGRRVLSHINDGYRMSSSAATFSYYATPWSLAGEDAIAQFLTRLAKKDIPDKDISISEEENGQVLVLEVVYDTKWRNKYWFLREAGYAISKAEIYNAAGFLAFRYHGIKHDSLDGVPFPKEATYSYYRDHAGSSVLYEESRLETESVTTNRRELPDSLFEMDIPKDAEVYDEDTNKYIRNPERLQKVLDEIAAESPRAVNNRFWFWTWLGIGAVALVIIALFVWRWRARPES